MSIRSGIIAAILPAVILATGSALADTKSIQGTVTGQDGKPLAGTEVRADRLDAKEATPAIAKTDAQGHYTFKALPVGAYAVTAYVKSVPKSRASVRTRSDGWAKVDFDLRMRPNDASIKKRYVWVKGEPGSHIGGRWVEIDEAKRPTTSAVDVVGTDDVNRMQRDMRLNTNPGMPGR
jgi:hypothetical protein